jgi:hypothetical protein
MDSPPQLDPKGAAGRLKPQIQLIPPALNLETAKALQHGADKYGPWNWRTAKVEIMTYLGAMKRHIDAVLNREDTDVASGAHHLGHVAASCGIVLDAAQNGTLVDNRPSATPVDCPYLAVVRHFHTTGDPTEVISLPSKSQPPAFKRPVDGMTLTSVMAQIRRTTVLTTNIYNAIEMALEPLFEPKEVR